MAIFDGLFKRTPAAASAPAPVKMTKPEFAGSFMWLQFYDGHHWQMQDETLERYAASVGPELRELMRFWTLMYLAFIFRKCLEGLEGEGFEKDMMDSLYKRLKQIPVAPGDFDIGTTINYWMDHLDVGTRATGIHEVNGEQVEMPACYFAALTFLRFDPSSPYYMHDETPRAVTAAVVRGLATVQDEMLPHVRNFAKRIKVP
jgi:hypothetical protein